MAFVFFGFFGIFLIMTFIRKEGIFSGVGGGHTPEVCIDCGTETDSLFFGMCMSCKEEEDVVFMDDMGW